MIIPSSGKTRHLEACKSAKNHKANHAIINCCQDTDVVSRRCSVKKVFLKVSQNLQESNCVRDSFFIVHLRWLLLMILVVGCLMFDRVLNTPLHEKCPYSEFFWSVFSRIWTEKNSKYGHFSHSALLSNMLLT